MRVSPPLRLLPCLCATLLLSGCWMGDRLVEETSCPRTGGIALRHNDGVAPLRIPQNYAPVCAINRPHGRDQTVSEVSFVVTYPDLQPVAGRQADELQNREIYLRITSGYGGGMTSAQNRAYIGQNPGDDEGLGHDMYVRKNPSDNGLADTYFNEDRNGTIPFVILCAPARRCEGNLTTADKAYRIDYFFTGIEAHEFSALDLKLRGLITGFYR